MEKEIKFVQLDLVCPGNDSYIVKIGDKLNFIPNDIFDADGKVESIHWELDDIDNTHSLIIKTDKGENLVYNSKYVISWGLK